MLDLKMREGTFNSYFKICRFHTVYRDERARFETEFCTEKVMVEGGRGNNIESFRKAF